MRILVTGGAGFIGSAVVRHALAQGHEVINLDALTYAACLSTLKNVAEHPRYHFVQADIRDRTALDRVFARFAPDAVMHLAAQTHVDRSITDPAAFSDTNIMGTLHLLEAARHYWQQQGAPENFRFHHVSTDEVFGSLPAQSNERFSEASPYAPRSPYAASKAGADHLVRSWHETYGLPTVITNCSNNYGPYHFPEKLIPLMITNALHEKQLPIYGDGQHTRDWLYVDDHADALLHVLERGIIGSSYTIGGNAPCRNIDLVETLCAILDHQFPRRKDSYADLIEFVADRPGHDLRYTIDGSRIERELGWQPRITLQAGLEKTVAWYLNNRAWWEPLLAREDAQLGCIA